MVMAERESVTYTEMMPGDRACECAKCTSCQRDGQQGLCEFILLPEKNTMCSDCLQGGCGSEINYSE